MASTGLLHCVILFIREHDCKNTLAEDREKAVELIIDFI